MNLKNTFSIEFFHIFPRINPSTKNCLRDVMWPKPNEKKSQTDICMMIVWMCVCGWGFHNSTIFHHISSVCHFSFKKALFSVFLLSISTFFFFLSLLICAPFTIFNSIWTDLCASVFCATFLISVCYIIGPFFAACFTFILLAMRFCCVSWQETSLYQCEMIKAK